MDIPNIENDGTQRKYKDHIYELTVRLNLVDKEMSCFSAVRNIAELYTCEKEEKRAQLHIEALKHKHKSLHSLRSKYLELMEYRRINYQRLIIAEQRRARHQATLVTQ